MCNEVPVYFCFRPRVLACAEGAGARESLSPAALLFLAPAALSPRCDGCFFSSAAPLFLCPLGKVDFSLALLSGAVSRVSVFLCPLGKVDLSLALLSCAVSRVSVFLCPLGKVDFSLALFAGAVSCVSVSA